MEKQQRDRDVNPLLTCSQSIISLAAPFRCGERGASLDADYREKILAGFDELERMAFERQIGMVILKDAKYALAAFVDEAVLTSAWPGRTAWMSRPLQLEMFGDHVAGEGFFERLSVLRQGGEANADLLELYYVCLQLGFEGVYKIRGLEQLMALQVDLRSQVDGYRGVLDPRISPSGIPRVGLMGRVRREVPYWVIGVATLAAVFFAYAGYSYTVGKISSGSLRAMEKTLENFVTAKQPLAVKAAPEARP